jgi:U3 small nucleolar RNA-associated protein 6
MDADIAYVETKPTKQSISDYAGNRRIFFIFERALRKFKGDLSLWLQYIEFAKANSANKTLGKIFAEYVSLYYVFTVLIHSTLAD